MRCRLPSEAFHRTIGEQNVCPCTQRRNGCQKSARKCPKMREGDNIVITVRMMQVPRESPLTVNLMLLLCLVLVLIIEEEPHLIDAHAYCRHQLRYNSSFWDRRRDEGRIVKLLNSCSGSGSSSSSIRQLEQIHAHLLAHGQSRNKFLLTKLIRSFADRGSLQHSRRLFDSVVDAPPPSIFLWTAMIKAYSGHDDAFLCAEALHLYSRMHCSLLAGEQPLAYTLSSSLKACARLSALPQGMQLHTHVFKYNFHSDLCVQTTLIRFYSACGCTQQMEQVFDGVAVAERDVQAWNTLIAGYAKMGDMSAARSSFECMPEMNECTWVEMISGYAKAGRMDDARGLIDTLLPPGDRNAVICTAMIAGYAKCGDISSARMMFDQIIDRDVASWNAIISAYSQAGLYSEALHLFQLMLQPSVASRVKPNQATMATVISTCAQVGYAELAQKIEDYVNSHGHSLLNLRSVTALIEMHAKCGDPDKAFELFQRWKGKDVVCYSSMIKGFAIHGRGLEALHIFHQLLEEGLQPDSICFIGVLSACSHTGLVVEGCHYFECMKNDYSIPPTADHYMCLVDLLGRAGRIEEAYRIITTVMHPVQPHAGIWGALLNACRIHCNVELGERAALHLLQLEPHNAGNYILLSNIYAKAKRWEDVACVRARMRDYVMRKPPGWSWIEVGGVTHRFLVATVQDGRLQSTLDLLGWDLIARGYILSPDDMQDDHNEYRCGASGILAVLRFFRKHCKLINLNVNLHMLGDQQVQNALTATCFSTVSIIKVRD
ncbi:hypothetical protein ACLOJK_039876 [Asimina triloba]